MIPAILIEKFGETGAKIVFWMMIVLILIGIGAGLWFTGIITNLTRSADHEKSVEFKLTDPADYKSRLVPERPGEARPDQKRRAR